MESFQIENSLNSTGDGVELRTEFDPCLVTSINGKEERQEPLTQGMFLD